MRDHKFNCFGCSIKADVKEIVDACKYESKLYIPVFWVPSVLIFCIIFLSNLILVEATPLISMKNATVSTFYGVLLVSSLIFTNTMITSYKYQNSANVKSSSSRNVLSEKERQDYKARLSTILSKSIQKKTVSYDKIDDFEHLMDFKPFLELHELLKTSFPLVFSSDFVSYEIINDYSILIEWKGSNPKRKPVLFAAHLDVVPEGNKEDWSIDNPFSGEIDEEGTIWGRGAIDNKHNVVCQLMAVEHMLANGIEQLEHSVFIALGHDEEIGGNDGAREIAVALKKRFNVADDCSNIYSDAAGVRDTFQYVFDEGPFLVKRLFPGLEKVPVGLIGVGEKGSVCMKLKVRCFPPGHSSMPRTNGETNVAVLAKAVARLESNPFPSNVGMFQETLLSMFSHLPWYLRMVAANMSIFGSLLLKFAEKFPPMIAGMRTTTAVTVVSAGNKINVVPGEATAIVNHRIHPSIMEELEIDFKDANHSPVDLERAVIEKVRQQDKKIINDSRVEVEYLEDLGFTPVAPVTRTDSKEFESVKNAVQDVFDAPVAATLMIGNTDTRHYWALSKNIFRFSPIIFESLEETKMFHGIDERISSQNLLHLFEFYCNLMQRSH